MRARCNSNGPLAALVALTLGGCMLVTDAGERKIDPTSSSRLDFTFADMHPHPQDPLDVALVSKSETALQAPPSLIARARIVLPPRVDGAVYPAQRLTMRGVLREGTHELLFYVDSNDDNEIEPDPQGGGEHIWIRKVPEVGEFLHEFKFEPFTEDDYASSQGDLVLDIDPARVVPWVESCLPEAEQTLEVEVIFAPNAERPSQRGYYKNHGANPLPTKAIRLEGIVDANSEYTVQVLVNGTVVRGLTTRAPEVGDFVVPFADWYPLTGQLLEAPGCP